MLHNHLSIVELSSGLVRRKILVLDLDETLIHSHHDGVARQTVPSSTPPDFVLRVNIDHHPVRFLVHKRPHVDYFLDVVSADLDHYDVIQGVHTYYMM